LIDVAVLGAGLGLSDGAVLGAGLTVGAAVGMPKKAALKSSKFIDPRPVTGSHPVAAPNPWRQHFETVHLLFPEVTSLAKRALFWYKAGLTQPNVDNPAALRLALTNATMPAKTGAEADVPYKETTDPRTTTL
jgi:hypothetical protein